MMKQRIKAAALGLALALSLFSCAPFSAWAEDDYPYSDRSSGVDEVDPWRFYYGGCTSFVAWRLNEVNGVAFDNFYGGIQWGNAAEWGSAARALGIPVDGTPAPGSVYWQDSYVHQASSSGHVAWVKKVLNEHQIVIEQYASGQYSEMTVPITYASGYIHICDLGGEPAPILNPGSLERGPDAETEPEGQAESDPGAGQPVIETEAGTPALSEETAEEEAQPEAAVQFLRIREYVSGSFRDVGEQWFAQSVADAFELGLMKGVSADSFNPGGIVKLDEAITMAARVHSIYSLGKDSFPAKVSGAAWYQPYLDYALANGIIDRATFESDVEQTASRAQFAMIFAAALPDEALAAINLVPDWIIPDVGMNEVWSKAVYKLYRAGILAGNDADGAFAPRSTITRAEAAAIVARMADSARRVSVRLDGE